MKGRSFNRMWRVCAAGISLSLAGCGESTGSVQGKVYLKEKLVTAGSVAFHAANNKVATARIQPDGSYHATAVGTGLAKVSVQAAVKVSVPKVEMKMDPAKMGAPDKAKVEQPTGAKAVDIPAQYADPEKSGVTFPVKTGANEFDIKLP